MRVERWSGGVSAQVEALYGDVSAPPAVACKRPLGASTRVIAEAAVLRWMARAGVARVPRCLFVRERGPDAALLMTWCLGAPLDAWMPHASPDAQARLARDLGDWLGRAHSCEVASDSGVKLAADPVAWGERLQRQLGRAMRQWDRRASAQAEAAYGALVRARAVELAAMLGQPERWPVRPRALVHRDLRPANVLVCEGGQLGAVIDFERACAGDPAWDFVKLGWWVWARWPQLERPMLAAYAAHRAPPEPHEVRLYALFEALTMLGYFIDRREDYPAQAWAVLKA